MGMAASQARFLGLTARKTNTEYEGQQVNQQRTALANQSAGLFNQMLELKVPTPPMATNYQKTEYIFKDPTNSEQITLDYIMKNPLDNNGNQYYTVDGSVTKKGYVYNTITRTRGTGANTDYAIKQNNTNPTTYSISIGGNDYTELFGPNTYDALVDEFNNTDGAPGDCNQGDTFYKYVDKNSGLAYFINSKDLDPGDPASYPNNLVTYSQQGYAGEESFHVDNAEMTTANDGTGRYTTITFYTGKDPVTGDPINKQTFVLELQTIQDDEAFNEAMNTYNAEKANYDKAIADIDAKTTIIQQQDRTLELHLTQLDTEQQAIQTEMDAVKKVIDKNIEETFKTFA